MCWAQKWELYGGRKGEYLCLYKDHRSGCTAHGQEIVKSVCECVLWSLCLYSRSDWHWLTGLQVIRHRTCRQHHRNLVSGGNQGQDTISLENFWDAFKALEGRWFTDLDTNHIVNAHLTVSFSCWLHQELLTLSARTYERNHHEIAALPSLRSKHCQKLLQVVDLQVSSGSLKWKEMQKLSMPSSYPSKHHHRVSVRIQEPHLTSVVPHVQWPRASTQQLRVQQLWWLVL